MIIAIVGKIGSGKSTCINYIKEHYKNVIVFSCDEIAKEILKDEKYAKLFKVNEDFYNDKTNLEKCRKEFHPIVFDFIKKEIEKLKLNNTNYLFLIETALPSTYLYQFVDKIICVYNSTNKKINILNKNRGYDENKTLQISDSQNIYEECYKKADYFIENGGEKKELYFKLQEVLNEIHFTC